MPDRYLREALLNSERWNALSLDAQNFYTRLILVVDDFGCYPAIEAMVRNTCYRYGRTQIVPMSELHKADLIVRYLNDGKQYLAFTQWGERVRRYRRYPAPPIFTDVPDIPYRGDERSHRAMDWRNPQRSADVSILLDHDLRPVEPQPPEWRRIDSDWMPLNSIVPVQAHKRGRSVTATQLPRTDHAAPTQSLHAPATQSLERGLSVATPASPRHSSKAVEQTSIAVAEVAAAAAEVTTQQPRNDHARPTATTPTNGKIELLDSGEWLGVSEEQRLRWQGMFDALSIPDQLDRAGAWLVAHPDKRREYSGVDGGLHSYLINWLLRESRGKAVSA